MADTVPATFDVLVDYTEAREQGAMWETLRVVGQLAARRDRLKMEALESLGEARAYKDRDNLRSSEAYKRYDTLIFCTEIIQDEMKEIVDSATHLARFKAAKEGLYRGNFDSGQGDGVPGADFPPQERVWWQSE